MARIVSRDQRLFHGVVKPLSATSRIVACRVTCDAGAGTYYGYCGPMGRRVRLLSVGMFGFANNGVNWDILSIWLKMGIGEPANLASIQLWQDVVAIRHPDGQRRFVMCGRSGSITFTCGFAFEGLFSRLGVVVQKLAGAGWSVNVLFEISEF